MCDRRKLKPLHFRNLAWVGQSIALLLICNCNALSGEVLRHGIFVLKLHIANSRTPSTNSQYERPDAFR